MRAILHTHACDGFQKVSFETLVPTDTVEFITTIPSRCSYPASLARADVCC